MTADPDSAGDLAGQLDRELAAGATRGHRALIAAVVRGDEQVCRGWSADPDVPDGSSLFEIGSITKAFTGVLLADMVLGGEVCLDDRLSRHLPDVAGWWRHREPTLLELATHRSGLPNTPGPMNRRELAYAFGVGKQDPWAAVSAGDYRRMVREAAVRRGPGGRVRYSSMAVGLLGEALAAASGMPYERLLAQRVLLPLGMGTTSLTVPPERCDRLVVGHSRRGRPRPPLQDLMPAAGSLRSTAEDMVRFLAACLRPPAGRSGDALRLARQPHARAARHLHLGLCWLLLDRPGHPSLVWHNGGTWGFRSFAGFAPEQNVAAVVLSNTARSVDRLGLRLIDAASPSVRRRPARARQATSASPHGGEKQG